MLDRIKVLHGPRTQIYEETNNSWQLSKSRTQTYGETNNFWQLSEC